MKAVTLVVSMFLAMLASAPAISASSEGYPDHAVKMVVPYSAGGPLDTLARIFAEKLSTAMGQPFVVENKPGANGNLGAEIVARAAPDGYTLLWSIDTQMTVNPALYSSMSFDPMKDLAPVSLVTTSDSVLVVNPSVPAHTIAELVALAKKRSLNFASGGYGSPAHMSTELLMAETGIKVTHVPYKGNAPAVASLLSGETQFSISSIPGVLQHIKTGRLRAIAVTGSKRSSALDLPTFAESGFPRVVVDGWRALFAPSGTPRPIIDKLNQELVSIAKLPEVKARLATLGLSPVASPPEVLAHALEAETPRWAKIIKDANIKVE